MPTKDTNSSGEATFDLQSGNYSVSVTEPGYADGTDSFSIGDNENITRVVTLSQEAQATLNVTVTDGSTGNALSGASVSAGGKTATTNTSGVATLSLDAGTYEVTANSGGYESNSAPVTLDWGETASMSIPLTAEAEPTLVDDFERTSIDPWVNTHAEGTTATITTAAGINSDRGLDVPAPADVEVSAGLENFPAASGGPNNDGAWECYVRFNETGGTLDSSRIYFAVQSDGSHLRWEFQGGGIGLRLNGSSELDFNISQGLGDVRILRMDKWLTNGDITCSVLDGNGSLLDQQSKNIGSAAPDSGSMRIWTNYSTGIDVDSMHLLG